MLLAIALLGTLAISDRMATAACTRVQKQR
jgi:hypothetical protein